MIIRYAVGRLLGLVVLLAVAPARAQLAPITSLYQVLSGTYAECCGFTGVPIQTPLPSGEQTFVQLALDPGSGLTTFSVLGPDGRTVFTTTPCLPSGVVTLQFAGGVPQRDSLQFAGSTDPASGARTWNFMVILNGDQIVVDGELVQESFCSDSPTHFSLQSLFARLIAPPYVNIVEISKSGTVVQAHGETGWTAVLEASNDLVHWEQIASGVLPPTVCPTCPFIQHLDPGQTGQTGRYYRCYQIP